MARVTVEDCLTQISNRFTLVIAVAKRVRQLCAGDKPLLESTNKPVVTALREVAAAKVSLDISKEKMAIQLEKLLKEGNQAGKVQVEEESLQEELPNKKEEPLKS